MLDSLVAAFEKGRVVSLVSCIGRAIYLMTRGIPLFITFRITCFLGSTFAKCSLASDRTARASFSGCLGRVLKKGGSERR